MPVLQAKIQYVRQGFWGAGSRLQDGYLNQTAVRCHVPSVRAGALGEFQVFLRASECLYRGIAGKQVQGEVAERLNALVLKTSKG
jgi:hypothetical protein